jgi:hypothetical protein
MVELIFDIPMLEAHMLMLTPATPCSGRTRMSIKMSACLSLFIMSLFIMAFLSQVTTPEAG